MPAHALLRDVSISDAAADVLTNQGLPRNAALLLATVDSAVQVDLEYLAKDMNGGKEIDDGFAGRVTTTDTTGRLERAADSSATPPVTFRAAVSPPNFLGGMADTHADAVGLAATAQ